MEKRTNLFEQVRQGVRPVPRRRVSRSTRARRRRHPRSSRHHLPRRRRPRPAGTWCSPPAAAPVRGRTGRRLRGIQRWRNSPRSPPSPPVDASHRPVAAPRRQSTHPPGRTPWLCLPPRLCASDSAATSFSVRSYPSASSLRGQRSRYSPTGSSCLPRSAGRPRSPRRCLAQFHSNDENDASN